MKCKNLFGKKGKKVCRLNSGVVVHLPQKIDTKIPVNIYTASTCNICNPIVNDMLKQLKPLKGIVKPNIIQIDKTKNIYDDILSLPSMVIGNNKMGSHIVEKDLITTIKRQIK